MKLHSILTRTLLAGALLALLTTASQASLILTNLNGNDLTQSFDIDLSRVKANAFLMGADSYSLDSAILRLETFSFTGTPTVRLYGDNGSGGLGSLLTSFTAPALAASGTANYTFTPDSPLTLAASTKYWLYLEASVTGGQLDWQASSPAVPPTGPGATESGSLFSSTGIGGLAPSNVISSYEIQGTLQAVPEPTTALFGLALVGFCTTARRRRAQAQA